MNDLLMVIDMQNDFVTKKGALYFEKAEFVKPAVLDIVRDRISKDYTIIFTKDWHDKDDLEFKRFPPHCVKNTYGSELFDDLKETIKDYENSIFILKRRFSAFFGTNLDEILKKLSPFKIEICGVDTNICVMYTVEELKNRDYDVLVYEDATGTYDEKLHLFAIDQMKNVLGARVEKWR
ncbi:cysteine hydrolase family protein [Athalassotoga saccharophila]|uniref:cysteine hydrolase family protein n=1 Tax=Athalassotoga saccharophila TaxID=1441386 RepID=UPI00137A1323|nr:isochorismatase family cysteine hydrolase [Athalassotoga saccharophila]BBJ28223.1 peroxyureidoacrylate/ureidoacrylate amidohydrolase RutB [Athalassotoga saccharophila]